MLLSGGEFPPAFLLNDLYGTLSAYARGPRCPVPITCSSRVCTRHGCRGGVEFGFMSTSLDKEMAVSAYARLTKCPVLTQRRAIAAYARPTKSLVLTARAFVPGELRRRWVAAYHPGDGRRYDRPRRADLEHLPGTCPSVLLLLSFFLKKKHTAQSNHLLLSFSLSRPVSVAGLPRKTTRSLNKALPLPLFAILQHLLTASTRQTPRCIGAVSARAGGALPAHEQPRGLRPASRRHDRGPAHDRPPGPKFMELKERFRAISAGFSGFRSFGGDFSWLPRVLFFSFFSTLSGLDDAVV